MKLLCFDNKRFYREYFYELLQEKGVTVTLVEDWLEFQKAAQDKNNYDGILAHSGMQYQRETAEELTTLGKPFALLTADIYGYDMKGVGILSSDISLDTKDRTLDRIISYFEEKLKAKEGTQ